MTGFIYLILCTQHKSGLKINVFYNNSYNNSNLKKIHLVEYSLIDYLSFDINFKRKPLVIVV